MENLAQNIDFSTFSNVFCDSLEALEWAYKNGLPPDAIIRTSSPAMLWGNNPNVKHIESRWCVDEMSRFQSTIQKFSEDVYNASLGVNGVLREEALCIARTAVQFQQVLFKASCLEKSDFLESRLFIRIEGNGGVGGNRMNAPWDTLLSTNTNFTLCKYTLKDDRWSILTTSGVSKLNRIKLGGLETIIYRVVIKFMKYLPDHFFDREVLIPSENELLIETAAQLALNGVKIRKISPDLTFKKKVSNETNRVELIQSILPIISNRIKRWVVPECVPHCENIFINKLDENIRSFYDLTDRWKFEISKRKIKKTVILTNSPGNFKGQSLAAACNALSIPIVSVQHGVSTEISMMHGEISVGFDNSTSDYMLAYTKKVKEVESHSHFSKAKIFIVGISKRHLRMASDIGTPSRSTPPIAYISTNLYKGNLGLFVSWLTDYGRARKEQKVVTKVLGKLPYKVRYKTYPDNNRRYADSDPVMKDILNSNNIEIYDHKIDMRYLLAEHRILVTTIATSTLSWLIMSNKPVVFINQKNNGPLTSDAYSSLSKGIFIFNDSEDGFYEKLRNFLSQPLADIDRMWEKKKPFREKMIEEYFTAYSSDAGKRAAKIIINNCF